MTDRTDKFCVIAALLIFSIITGCASNAPTPDTTEATPSDSTQAEPVATETTTPSDAAKTDARTDMATDTVVEIIPLDADAGAPTEVKEAPKKEKPAPAAAKTDQAPPKTINVKALTSKIEQHRRTLWLSRTSSYRFYVGGIVDSIYDPAKSTLTISSGNSDSPLTCEYSIDGKLNKKNRKDSEACLTLAHELHKYLQN
ncbi:MAG: hypothetical protein ACE5EH_09775 [Gammaproteobacteria bacterium]